LDEIKLIGPDKLLKASAIFEALVTQLEFVRNPDKESVFTTYSYITELNMNSG
jgi:hypothetical protein